MKICVNPPAIKPDLSRLEAIPALTIYMTALASYQRRRTATGKAALLKSYVRWIRGFLDNEAEVNRAANNFVIALRNQPPESREAA